MNAPTERHLAVLPPNYHRRKFIGGSDAGAIIGCGARYGGIQQTPLTVFQKKTALIPEELDPAREKFFRRRKAWEEPIVDMLREEFSAQIVAMNHRYLDPEVDYFCAEIDFEWIDPETGLVENGEIKTVSPFAFGEKAGWGKAGTDEVPYHYLSQCMHGLGVTGRRKTVLAAMVGIDSMQFYTIHRDDELIAQMRAECVRFWTENVLPGVAPDPSNWEEVMQQFAKFNGRPVDLNEETYTALVNLKKVRSSIKAYEDDLERLQMQVAEYILKQWKVPPGTPDETVDNALLRFDQVVVGSWKKQRGAHLDQKRLRKEKPSLIDEYTKTHYFRQFRVS